MNTIRVVVPILIASFLLVPSSPIASGTTFFDEPDLGGDVRQVITPYVDHVLGLTYTALPIGGSAEIGLVRSNASAVCIDQQYNGQMLGTAPQGSGDIGSGSFPIRVDFAVPVAAPAVISVTLQTAWDAVGSVALYDAANNLIGVNDLDETANKVLGSCPPGGFESTGSGYYTARASSPVAYAIISTNPPAIFVIDDFQFLDNFVSVESTTWGRVKALYR